jgi:sialate O-acetylesterase
MHTRPLKALCALALLLGSASADAALLLPQLFADGMVLQREQPIHVWGWAAPGKNVRIGFDGQSASAVAGKSGRWGISLPAHVAGGPYALAIQGDGGTVSFVDVWVGDVWLCSGQSNMEFSVSGVDHADAEIAAATDGLIHQFKVPRSWALSPQERLAGGSWAAASPQTVGDFTAVGYFFARDLRARLGVPIGLINSTWGGSSIEAWSDEATLGADAATMRKAIQQAEVADRRSMERTRQRLKRWPADQHGMVGDKPVWADPGLDDSDWDSIPAATRWEQSGYDDMDGFAWYRTSFELSAEDAAKGVTLGLGMIDDSDQTWVNGHPVGGMTLAWNTPRVYAVAPEALHAGRNVIAIRVEDVGAGGGEYGPEALRYVRTADGVVHPLEANWKFRTDRPVLTLDDKRNQYPTGLYNQMIHPMLPYPIKGVIWYQGETNATDQGAYDYRRRFARLIGSWRDHWGEGELPFLWVQLANFTSGEDSAGFSPWATLRDSQSAALELPGTGQAVIIDIGDPGNIHPRDKQDVGRRLALAALHQAYGKDLVYSGPTYDKIRFDGAKAVVSFAHLGGGLAARGGGTALQGFSIAGADRRFVPAQAVIDGDNVVVWSQAVTQPAAVAYAWSDNPAQADLVNKEGLPASPFRTDTWLAECPVPGAACVAGQAVAAGAAAAGNGASQH